MSLQHQLFSVSSTCIPFKDEKIDEIFSPQTRYFNAGLGRTEAYIW